MVKNNIIAEAKPNAIVAGTTIKGEIISNGDFRIDGQLVGSIICKGKIVVGQSGTIEGEIECQNADLSGTIKAKVKVEQLLSLKASAKLNGEVITSKISIEPGAKFSGSCNMDGGMTKPEHHVQSNPEQPKEKIFK